MIDVFVFEDDCNNVGTASGLREECIGVQPPEGQRSFDCSIIRADSLSKRFEINNNHTKDCGVSLANGSLSSEDFDDNSSCDNVDKKSKQRQARQQASQAQSPRGILKYPFDWPQCNRINPDFQADDCKHSFRSSVSTSTDSDDQGYYGTSCDSPTSLPFFDTHYTPSQSTQDRKHITWADKDVVFVFRKGSSILGCRKKNQKKAQKKREKARAKDEDEGPTNDGTGSEKGADADIEAVRQMIANQRFSVTNVDDFGSISDDASSSGCDCSTSEASGDDEETSVKCHEEPMNYQDEKTFAAGSSKQKRKKQRKRNRKSKQNVRNQLETGYDSE